MRSRTVDPTSNRSSDPSYTAYLGTPRQDVPRPVLRDPAMYDDVFDKKGQFMRRTTPKIFAPLDTQQYNSLHDPHCKRLFLNNKWLRGHLTELGLVTQDQKVVASTREQRETIRAHEMLERKEQLLQKLEEQEQKRLERMNRKSQVPSTVRWSQDRDKLREQLSEERRQRIQENKMTELQRAKEKEAEEKSEKKVKWKKFVEEYELNQQRQRSVQEVVQKEQDLLSYVNRYGMSPFGLQLAGWHRDSDVIAHKMREMALKRRWNKMEKKHDQELSLMLEEGSSEQEPNYLKKIMDTKTEKSDLAPDQKDSEVEVNKDGNKEGERVTPTVQDVTEEKPVEGIERRDSGSKSDSKSDSKELEVKPPTGDAIEKALTSVLGETFVSPTDERVEVEERGPTPPGGQEQTEVFTEPAAPSPPPPSGVTSLPHPSGEESAQLVSEFMIHMLAGYDQNQMGYVDTATFLQVLMSRETGLKLAEDEVYQILQYVDPEGTQWISYYDAAALMREVLLVVFAARSEVMKPTNPDDEEAWRQMHTPSFGLLYFNIADGRAQRERPVVFRPYLEDEVFEDTIVDFFETADTNRDKYINEDDFRDLLFSPTVKDQLYEEQKEDLIGLFSSSATDSRMTLEEFVPLARTMVTMVYRRHYEGQTASEWLELTSTKYGPFWLNKNTGETLFPQEEQTIFNAPLKRTSMASEQFFGTESLPSVGDFDQPSTSRPVTYPYQVQPVSTMGYNVVTPPTETQSISQQHKKRKLKKKQRSSVATREGRKPPALRRRSQASTVVADEGGTGAEPESSENDHHTDPTNPPVEVD